MKQPMTTKYKKQLTGRLLNKVIKVSGQAPRAHQERLMFAWFEDWLSKTARRFNISEDDLLRIINTWETLDVTFGNGVLASNQ